LGSVQDFDHGLFVAAGGFTNDVNTRNLLHFFEQLAQTRRSVSQLVLPAQQMNLQGGFGDIDSGIDNGVF